MADDSKRVDQYIGKAPDFAKPILEKLRKAVHRGCPGVVEEIKWGVPYFTYNGILCGMAFFKKHVSLGFWKSSEMEDPEGLFETGTGRKASMCNAHFHSLKELPTQKILVEYIKRAAKLNDESSTASKRAKPSKKATKIATRVPADLSSALKKHAKARAFFASLAPGQKRDYIQWITESKREATREKRLATTIEWLNDGKKRHWKYEKC